ncbi:MAG: hypothetical protein AAF991_09680 [Pseudomonadota bacterium]
MNHDVFSRTTMTGIGIAAAAFALPSASLAQDTATLNEALTDEEVQQLPTDLQTGPVVTQDLTETTVGPDGVETITRTRRIESSTPYPAQPGPYPVTQGYTQTYAPAYGYAPGAQVFEREQWLEECERRTSGRDNREKGGIIGGLLGAIAGGIIGNRVADGSRLGGTLLGAGVGGLGGVLIGSLIGGGRNDRGEYDCEAALDSYLSQYGYGAPRIAARTIPAPAYATPAYHAYAAPPVYGYGYAPAYQSYGYSYAPPQQIVYVPIEYQQQQRVVVRETIREEVIPGARRVIPAPRPVPRPVEPRYIKGN